MEGEETQEKPVEPVEEEKKEEQPEAPAPSTNDVVDSAREIVERQEKANTETERILNEQKEFAAKQLLHGRADAGQGAEKPKEETDSEYKDRIMRGEI